MADRVEVQCPCCSTKLVVDGETGDILSEERPKVSADKSFDDAMKEIRAGSQKRQSEFDKAFDRTKRQDDILEKKFAEAREKAKEDDSGRPRSPFDLD